MEFSKQGHWSVLPFPPAGDLLDPGIKPESLASPRLAGRFFTTALPGKSISTVDKHTTKESLQEAQTGIAAAGVGISEIHSH